MINQEAMELFAQPMMELLYQAQTIHRQHFNPNEVQLATLYSLKTGACPEDCRYCSQSARYKTGISVEKMTDTQSVIDAAKQAKAAGATRFCISAGWRSPKEKDLAQITGMVKEIKALGLETCATLGMLDAHQADTLKSAGLDYYNHNLDTSPEFYPEIITTRCYQDRLDTLDHVRQAGIKVCCGGIIGLGESREDRASLLSVLASLSPQPESVPINRLIPIQGTPLENTPAIDELEFVRTIAVARILLPHSYIRLSAGRMSMSDAMQALCFFAGANSIFYGDKLLTTANPEHNADRALLDKLGMVAHA